MKELKSVPMSFRFSPRVKECLSKAAAHEGRSQANFLEWLLLDYCEKHNIAASSPKATKGGAK
jgi:hypothetical protein